MSFNKLFQVKTIAILFVGLITMASVYAFAAANVVPTSGAGDGSEVISGYTVSNVTYDTNDDGDPSTLDEVTFDLAGAATPTEVFAQVDASSPSWFTCAGGPTTWACTITSTNTVDADQLTVVAAQ